MCERGDTVAIPVRIAESHSSLGVEAVKEKPIDRCIAPLVVALQHHGIDMLGSCCGHGESDGEILLADGRTLAIKEGS